VGGELRPCCAAAFFELSSAQRGRVLRRGVLGPYFVFEIFVGGLMRGLLLTGLKAETTVVVQFGRALG
jgi:hypothetical protein